MVITNRYNLPKSLYKAMVKSHGEYHKEGDYSITEILNPPQIVHLTSRYYDQIEVDVTDLIPSFIGNLGHAALEAAAHGMAEKRLAAEVCGRIITGKADHYDPDDKAIEDYKFWRVGAVGIESRLHEATEQLNSYAWLFSKHGYEVHQLRLMVFFKDWFQKRVGITKDYPPYSGVLIPLLLRPYEETEEAIQKRVQLLVDTENYASDILPPCLAADRWESPEKFAIHVTGLKRARKLCDTLDEVEEYIRKNEPPKGKKFYIDHRQADPVRCISYCDVSKFCHQYQKYLVGQAAVDKSDSA